MTRKGRCPHGKTLSQGCSICGAINPQPRAPAMTATPSREEMLALATDLSNDKPGSRTRAAEMLRRLAAKPANEGVSQKVGDLIVQAAREATIEECAKIAEQEKPGFCGNKRDEAIWYAAERIANNIRALSTGQPKPP